MPDVKWIEIGGLENVKRELQEAVEWPLRYPEIYKTIGYNMPRGILLYGPSGTGKTLLAKAVATESEANFISVKGTELLSKWVGESERGIREIFRRARQASPCVIFFDEIDSIVPVRGMGESAVTEKVVSQLLTELDGIESLHGVVVIAATNRADMIDKAMIRPGRFDKMVLVPMPEKEVRMKILEINSKEIPIDKEKTIENTINPDYVDLEQIAKDSEGLSGADVASIANTASSLVIHEFLEKYPDPKEAEKQTDNAKITMRHFEQALRKVRTQKELKTGEKITVSHFR